MIRPHTTGGALRTNSCVGWRLTPPRPQLVKVTDRVYSAVDYAISNAIFVITDTSVVVIDTTISRETASATLNEFRRVCKLPVSYIIYTHFHGDHTLGAKVFHTPATKVIAQEGFAEELARMRLLLPYKRRVNLIQWGFDVKGKDDEISLTEERGRDGYIPPSITFDEEYRFEEGGLRFELYHTQGETFDHLMVW